MSRELLHELIASSVGGGVGVLIGQPLDLIKTRAMVGSVPQKGICKLMQTEGWLAPLKGSMLPMLGQGLYSSVAFTVFSFARNHGIDIFTAGCIGGAASVLITTPCEVIKIGLQMNTGFVQKGNLRQVVRSIYQKKKLPGFYLGFWPTFVRDSPSTGIYFYSYHECHRILHREKVYNQRLREVLAGGTAGVLSWIFVIPVDVVKSRVQYSGGTIRDCTRSIYREAGIHGFFRGTLPCIARAFPVNAATFVTYEETLRYVRK